MHAVASGLFHRAVQGMDSPGLDRKKPIDVRHDQIIPSRGADRKREGLSYTVIPGRWPHLRFVTYPEIIRRCSVTAGEGAVLGRP